MNAVRLKDTDYQKARNELRVARGNDSLRLISSGCRAASGLVVGSDSEHDGRERPRVFEPIKLI